MTPLEGGMETCEEWLKRTGQNTRNVGAIELAKAAWEGAKAQSTNYVCDDDTFPPQYEIHIISLASSIRLNQVQFDDLRKALLEHERNGFRDGWSRVGSVSITEVGARESKG